jgi:septal ring factor EnvC (AmiA/AmiB activator)
MSDKCSHNNHRHFLLWVFVFSLSLNSCLDCSGEQTRIRNSVISLNNSVFQLQTEVSLLKGNNSNLQGRVTALESQLTKSEVDNDQLKKQLEQIRNIKKEFYK